MNLNQSLFFLLLLAVSCTQPGKQSSNVDPKVALQPLIVTEPVNFDSDDPAIWIHPDDPAQSLVLGTDKMENEQGSVFIFDLKGKVDTVITGIDRPNNIDVAYGFPLGSEKVDFGVVTERVKHRIRIFSIPDMQFIDGGGIPVFEDDAYNAVMGVAIYAKPGTSEFYAIVSRKENPDQNDDYLYQYRLVPEESQIKGKLVRKFGAFEGSTEIEAIAVDHELGYVYYSDEGYGIRKYYADPSMGNEPLAVFGLDGFASDREGISIFKSSENTGYILVSDQQANQFRVFPREGTSVNPHEHPLIAAIPFNTNESDGSEVVNFPLNGDFPKGLFVAMSDNKTFELYDWQEVQAAIKESEKKK
jgi:3-phytase